MKTLVSFTLPGTLTESQRQEIIDFISQNLLDASEIEVREILTEDRI